MSNVVNGFNGQHIPDGHSRSADGRSGSRHARCFVQATSKRWCVLTTKGGDLEEDDVNDL